MSRENTRIADIQEGEEFIGFYALKRCDLKDSEGKVRLEIEISDRTGSLPGVIWEDPKPLRDLMPRGSVVKVKGRLGSYRDKPQVKIDKIRPAKTGEFDPESFLPVTECDVEALVQRVMELVESIQDPALQQLGHLIFGNPQFMKEFRRSPGGSNWHHGCLGGLIEHSVSVAEICEFIASRRYELNRDLLVLAALMHDVGKIREFSAATTIEYSDEGRLEGHVVMGERFVRNMTERVENFPPRLRMMLSHLMLSHHGHRDFNSPVEPMIPEGFALYYADELDAKLDALKRIMRENAGSGKDWSDFNRILGRYLYTGERR